MTPRLLAPLILASLIAPSALAQHATTEFGIDFVTVGDPGNAPVPPEFFEYFTPQPWGSVGYDYRIARTELSLGQWHEFVTAYLPHYDGTINSALTSSKMRVSFGQVLYNVGYQPDHPADMSWEFAARYCNWLHNGKVNEAWAFESGAYDTSTFYEDEHGVYHHQLAHSPDARYWIPTHDEWVKAAHYDPNRHGPGDGGYWIYPNASDEPLIPGLPEEGGETNAGYQTPRTPIGAYPDVQSPWGLLDVSGGVREWTSTMRTPTVLKVYVRATESGGSFPELWDRVDFDQSASVRGVAPTTGLRIAAAVPAPASACALGLFAFALAPRRR